MASFKALNIESDDESDDEIDNTKEIQIEEALKLYQAALKHHSQQGTLERAGKAYEELFDSDIFKLPEAQSEFERVVNFQGQSDIDASYFSEVQENDANDQAIAESAPSSLPQILHLSYKNRGEYHLDLLQHLVNNGGLDAEKIRKRGSVEQNEFSAKVLKALEDFAQALDKDEDDLDLWRRAARVCQMLGSQRAARFCLEAALDGDEEGTDDILSLPNFELEMDEKQLNTLLTQVQDRLSVLLQPPSNANSRHIPKPIYEKLKLYPNIPSPLEAATCNFNDVVSDFTQPTTLEVSGHSMDALGNAILKCILSLGDKTQQTSGGIVRINLPPPIEDNDKSAADPLQEQERKQSHDSNSAGQNKDAQGQHSPIQNKPKPGSRRNTVTLPSRKRSMDTANISEAPEGERTRSKRIKARQSTVNDRNAGDAGGLSRVTLHDSRIEVSIQADRWLFNLVGDLDQKIGVPRIAPADEIRRLVMPETPLHSTYNSEELHLRQSIIDFYAAMQSWNRDKQRTLGKTLPSSEGNAITDSDSGLQAFLGVSEPKNRKKARPLQDGAQKLSDIVNSGSFTIQQVAMLWVETLLSQGAVSNSQSEPSLPNVYLELLWTENLKLTLESIISYIDTQLFEYVSKCPDLHKAITASQKDPETIWKAKLAAANFAEAVFEMQLDIFSHFTSSDVKANDQCLIEHQTDQHRRMQKWSALARDYLGSLEADIDLDGLKAMDISLRHMWATVYSIHLAQEIPRDSIIAYIEDLKHVCEGSHSKVMYLQNCTTIPELSAEAVDKEISKLETMDFFSSIFHKDNQHPVDTIEKLEPILIPPRLEHNEANAAPSDATNGVDSVSQRIDQVSDAPSNQGLSKRQLVLYEFVGRSSFPLRHSLWSRLQRAYLSIDFPGKLLYVNLKIFGLILDELKSKSYENAGHEGRECRLLQSLRKIDDLMHKTHDLVQSHAEVVSALDDDSLKEFLGLLQELWVLLYTVALFDDYSQLVQKNPPLTNPFRTYPSESFHPTSIKLHELQILIIIVTYRVFQEAMARYSTNFAAPGEDKLEFLRYVHYSLGMRRICKASDNMLLRFMKDELQELSLAGRVTSDDFAQILYDLYDLHLFSSPGQRQDHGCEPDYLDRATADGLVDFVLERAKAANMRDLPKLELGKTVEKIQNALGPVKSSLNTLRNKKIYNTFVKSPINPMELFQSLKGVGYLSSVVVSPQEAPIASKRWYRLMAEINMAKYRKLRGNISQEAEEDVEDAVTFVVHDLEYTMDDWESWLLLANANDALINESVIWSADKLNTEKNELAQLQRVSIHAYSMALATALRTADVGKTEVQKKLADLYADFGMRIYSSSQPPFSMGAFSPKEFQDKFCCATNHDGGLYTRKAFRPLRQTQAYRLAYALFAEAVNFNPQSWTNYFMLGKCLWKIHQSNRREDSDTPSLALSALKAFQRAADRLPPRKGQQEPSLEPMYKGVFVINKLVELEELTQSDGASRIEKTLQQQKQFDSSNLPKYIEDMKWIDHIINVLKYLRGVDKARWHHRIAFKVAQLLYLKHEKSDEGAKLAKDYLLDSHLYTAKTLALTVWKPDSERAGRHWIYMSRYARFLCDMLEQTNDLEALQALARRVRKKTNEFYEHARLWEHVCSAHLNAYRRYGDIPVNGDDGLTKSVTLEEFNPQASRADAWTSSLENTHSLLDVLREASELKKLNGSLFKTTEIDNLLVDTWSAIYSRIGPTLPPLPSEPQKPQHASSTLPNPIALPAATATASPSASQPAEQGKPPLKIFEFERYSTPDPRAKEIAEANGGALLAGKDTNKPSDPNAAPTGTTTNSGPSRTRIAHKFVSRKDLLKHATEGANARAANATANNTSSAGNKAQQDGKSSNTDGAGSTTNHGKDAPKSRTNGTSSATVATRNSDARDTVYIESSEPTKNGSKPMVIVPTPRSPAIYPADEDEDEDEDTQDQPAKDAADKKSPSAQQQQDLETSSELSDLEDLDVPEDDGEGNQDEENDAGSEGGDDDEEQEQEQEQEGAKSKSSKFTPSPSISRKPVMFPNLRRNLAAESGDTTQEGTSAASSESPVPSKSQGRLSPIETQPAALDTKEEAVEPMALDQAGSPSHDTTLESSEPLETEGQKEKAEESIVLGDRDQEGESAAEGGGGGSMVVD